MRITHRFFVVYILNFFVSVLGVGDGPSMDLGYSKISMYPLSNEMVARFGCFAWSDKVTVAISPAGFINLKEKLLVYMQQYCLQMIQKW